MLQAGSKYFPRYVYLQKNSNCFVSDAAVKVFLLQNGKKVAKKRTSVKRGEKNPIFNEAMIFSVPANALSVIYIECTCTKANEESFRWHQHIRTLVGYFVET